MFKEEQQVKQGFLPPLTLAQQVIANFPTRFRVCCTGRRWGKSLEGGSEAILVANQGGQVWWLAPAIKTLNAGLDTTKLICDPLMKGYGVKFRNSSAKIPTFIFPSGGKIEFHTANDPNTLRGASLDLAVFDEAAFIHPDVWPYVISPMLADRKGRAIFYSTPHGRNWFYDLYNSSRYFVESRGNKLGAWETREEVRGFSDWASFRFSSFQNPTIDPEEFQRLVDTLPDSVVQQEIFAEFMDDASSVFRGIKQAAIWAMENPQTGHMYVIGVDLAKTQDYTVIIVFDLTTMRQVYMERFQNVDYPTQVERIGRIYDRWRPVSLWIEKNMNESVVDYLNRDGIPAQPFITSGPSKNAMIQSWSLAIENGEVGLLNDPFIIDEHLSFEIEISSTNHATYSAPSGKHDDCVMASAIAWYGVTQAMVRKPLQIARGNMSLYGSNTPRRQYQGYASLKDKGFGRRR